MNINKQIKIVIISATVLTMGMQLSTSTVGATAGPKGQRKVLICHATNSHSNPYTINKVDKSSIDEVNNKFLNGHGDHEGPVWFEGIADHSWGDIIPPFTNDSGKSYPGQNWTQAGKSIYENDCNIPKPETETPTTPTTPTTPNTPGNGVQGGGTVLGTSTTPNDKAILAETGTPLVLNTFIGMAVIAAASYASIRNHKLETKE